MPQSGHTFSWLRTSRALFQPLAPSNCTWFAQETPSLGGCKKFRSLLAAAGSWDTTGARPWLSNACLKTATSRERGKFSGVQLLTLRKQGLSPRGGNPHGGTGHCSPRAISPSQTLHPGLTLLSWQPRDSKNQGRGCRNAEFSLVLLIPAWGPAAFAQPSALSSPCVATLGAVQEFFLKPTLCNFFFIISFNL